MAKRRTIQHYGNGRSWVASEDGKQYLGHTTDVNQLVAHIQRRNQQMNARGAHRGHNGWGFRAALPMHLVRDWLMKNHYTEDQWARNEDHCFDKCIRHFQSAEYRKLWAGENYGLRNT